MEDVLIEFGSVTHASFTSLQDIASVVQHSVGVSWERDSMSSFYFSHHCRDRFVW